VSFLDEGCSGPGSIRVKVGAQHPVPRGPIGTCPPPLVKGPMRRLPSRRRPTPAASYAQPLELTAWCTTATNARRSRAP